MLCCGHISSLLDLSGCRLCMQELAKLNKPFKYVSRLEIPKLVFCLDKSCPCSNSFSPDKLLPAEVVTCIIMQKSGAPLHTGLALHWDTKTDGTSCVQVGTDTMDSWQEVVQVKTGECHYVHGKTAVQSVGAVHAALLPSAVMPVRTLISWCRNVQSALCCPLQSRLSWQLDCFMTCSGSLGFGGINARDNLYS